LGLLPSETPLKADTNELSASLVFACDASPPEQRVLFRGGEICWRTDGRTCRGAARPLLFVGRPNGAGSGAPRPVVTLPHSKMVITFCVMQVWNPNGQLIESRPFEPTVPVKWTVDDLLQGRDPDLEAAARHLQAP
jgi:hypothetical protein